jgi:Rrf2 family cysteine metabolism transcriptional repressor
MLVTQKHRYAIRAIYELARRAGSHPVKLAEIAEAQAIPLRFLEVIMAELKGTGLILAKRGCTGGYLLAKAPEQIAITDIIRGVDRHRQLDRCNACLTREQCPLHGECAFMPLWDRVHSAIYTVFDQITIQDLIVGGKHNQGLDIRPVKG